VSQFDFRRSVKSEAAEQVTLPTAREENRWLSGQSRLAHGKPKDGRHPDKRHRKAEDQGGGYRTISEQGRKIPVWNQAHPQPAPRCLGSVIGDKKVNLVDRVGQIQGIDLLFVVTAL
jgi:hypothetical protein